MRFSILYALNYLCSNVKKHLAVIIMMTLSLLLCGATLYLVESHGEKSERSDKILRSGAERTGIAAIEASGENASVDLHRKIDGVVSFGYYQRISLRSVVGANKNLAKLNSVFASEGLRDLCNLKLSQGEWFDSCDEGVWYAYVGSDVEDVSVGDTYTAVDYYGEEHSVIVRGILEEGSRWLCAPDNFLSTKVQTVEMALDNGVIYFSGTVNRMVASALFYVAEEGKFASASENIRHVLAESHCSAKTASFAEILAQSKNEDISFAELLRPIVIMIVFSTVVLLACTETVMILNSRSDIGVWYANGAKRRQVLVLFLTAFLFITAVALVIAGILSIAFVGSVSKEEPVRQLVRNVLVRRVYPKCVLIAVGINILGLALPLYTLLKETPVKLLRSFHD